MSASLSLRQVGRKTLAAAKTCRPDGGSEASFGRQQAGVRQCGGILACGGSSGSGGMSWRVEVVLLTYLLQCNFCHLRESSINRILLYENMLRYITSNIHSTKNILRSIVFITWTLKSHPCLARLLPSEPKPPKVKSPWELIKVNNSKASKRLWMAHRFPYDFAFPTTDFICVGQEESSFNFINVYLGSLINVKSCDMVDDLGC